MNVKKDRVILAGLVFHHSDKSAWGFAENPLGIETHKITFDLVDGEPDCSSIKMEKL